MEAPAGCPSGRHQPGVPCSMFLLSLTAARPSGVHSASPTLGLSSRPTREPPQSPGLEDLAIVPPLAARGR